jgi:hypothetical protein
MYSAEERNQLIQLLDTTRDGLMKTISGLSQSQSTFKLSPDAWSVAGIVEHLAIVEDRVLGRISELFASAPPESQNGRLADSDTVLFYKVVDRSSKFQAPEPVHPTGKSLAESLDRLRSSRDAISALIRSAPSDFRERSMPHPVFGPLDSHQWFVAAAGHCGRHTEQIIEAKAAQQFPAS